MILEMSLNIMRLINMPCDPKLLSPLTLAFIGDGVFELMVREKVVCTANCPAGELHKQTVERVKAAAQSEAYKKIQPVLTEAEASVYKRGRNAHTARVPKNANIADYHSATGFEALFGYLYLTGGVERLRALFEIIFNS